MEKWLQYCRSFPAKWRRHSRTERRLLVEAFVLLGVARLLVLAVPFKWLARTMGTHMSESAPQTAPSDLRFACMIGRAVRCAANNTPWKSVCLPQAVTGQWMLKRRGIAATLYLGVAKKADEQEKLAAHAWLRCGDAILTGAAGHRQFAVVATFAFDNEL